ncbi:MAG: hypothetical protein WBE76_11835 [Terracidiphilus sp.]
MPPVQVPPVLARLPAVLAASMLDYRQEDRLLVQSEDLGCCIHHITLNSDGHTNLPSTSY